MKKISIISALILNAIFVFSQITYQYDNLNRLSRVNYPNGASIVYTYDELGNRLTKGVTASTSTIAVTGVSLNKTATSLAVGATENLTATVSPANATNKNVNWSSSNAAVATVSASGQITAISAGAAIITVKTVDGDFSAVCNVTVTQAPVPVPTLSQLTVSQGTLTPSFSPAVTQYTVDVGNAITAITLAATPADPAASIAGTGAKTLNTGANVFQITVTGISGGTQTYTVTVNRQVPSTPSTIAVTGVGLNPATLSLTVAQTGQLTATVVPDNATNKQLIWESSNEATATVSATGLVTAQKAGTATIRVRTADGNKTDYCIVTVTEALSVIPEAQPVTESGNGVIALSLSIPSNSTLTGSFEIQLPQGMVLDEVLTALIPDLSKSYYLVFTYKGNNTWLIEIKAGGLRSAPAEYRKIMDIAYKIVGNVSQGQYEATITNLNFTLNNGTSIQEDNLPVPISILANVTSIESIGNSSFHVGIVDNILRIESPEKELITIYSFMGARLYSSMKERGRIEIAVSAFPGSMFIVHGSVSGAVKVVKN